MGRRYLERGFLDAAIKLFTRNADLVTADDWSILADRLMDRQRVTDVVRVCELGCVPLPREQMLALGDAHLRRNDLDAAIRLYEVADADRARWSRLVDCLIKRPDRERQALGIAERHLASDDDASPHLMAVGR